MWVQSRERPLVLENCEYCAKTWMATRAAAQTNRLDGSA